MTYKKSFILSIGKRSSSPNKEGCSEMTLSSTDCIAWLSMYFTESVAIVTLNLVTIIVFIKSRSLRKRSLYLVINLAVADMLCGGFSQAVMDFGFYGAHHCNFWKFKISNYTIIAIVYTLFPFASFLNITVISLDRIHATFRPFRHRVIRGWVYGLIISLIWVTALLMSLTAWLQIFESRMWISVILLCLFVICVCYVSITLKMSGRCCGARPRHHGAANREKKLTCTMFIMTLVSLFLWLPWTLLSLFSLNTVISLFTTVRLIFALKALMYANSLVNPITYTIRMPEFKRALVSLLRCRSQQIQVEIPLQVM